MLRPIQIGKPGKGAVTMAPATLAGADALHGLSKLLPHLNQEGGSKRNVRDATATIQEVTSLESLLQLAATNKEARLTHYRVPDTKSILGVLPARLRLALEMALHDEEERRAMEGQLAELEARWKEADAIARIADNLFLPDKIDEEIARIRTRDDHPKG